MKIDAISEHDDPRRKAAGEFIGSCICAFCRRATRSEVAQLGPRLEAAAREYANAELAGMGLSARAHRERMLDILDRVTKP